MALLCKEILFDLGAAPLLAGASSRENEISDHLTASQFRKATQPRPESLTNISVAAIYKEQANMDSETMQVENTPLGTDHIEGLALLIESAMRDNKLMKQAAFDYRLSVQLLEDYDNQIKWLTRIAPLKYSADDRGVISTILAKTDPQALRTLINVLPELKSPKQLDVALDSIISRQSLLLPQERNNLFLRLSDILKHTNEESMAGKILELMSSLQPALIASEIEALLSIKDLNEIVRNVLAEESDPVS